MKYLSILAMLFLFGCSGLQSPLVPTPTPVAVAPVPQLPALPPAALAAVKMVCSSPAATTDPRIMAGCMVLQMMYPAGA